jgi:hypothetical protein
MTYNDHINAEKVTDNGLDLQYHIPNLAWRCYIPNVAPEFGKVNNNYFPAEATIVTAWAILLRQANRPWNMDAYKRMCRIHRTEAELCAYIDIWSGKNIGHNNIFLTLTQGKFLHGETRISTRIDSYDDDIFYHIIITTPMLIVLAHELAHVEIYQERYANTKKKYYRKGDLNDPHTKYFYTKMASIIDNWL